MGASIREGACGRRSLRIIIMKIQCACGHLIHDGPDQNPQIGHLIPDQEWSRWLEAIDAAIEADHATTKGKEAACMRLRYLVGKISRRMWQCRECGRLMIDDDHHQLHEYVPATEATSKEIFRAQHDA